MSEGTIGPWRDLLKQFQAAPVKKKRLRLLRQTAKKAKTFLAQKTVRLLRSARDRLGAACKAEPENAAAVAKSNAKQAKLAARLERTLAAVKAVDLDLLSVAAMVKLEGQSDPHALLERDSDQSDAVVGVMKDILKSSAMTRVIDDMRRGPNRKNADDGSSYSSSSTEIEECDRVRMNRPGQRARRALAERKYGAKAKHLVAQRNAAGPVRAQSKEPKVHPSWAAAQKQKALQATAAFTGTKTKF